MDKDCAHSDCIPKKWILNYIKALVNTAKTCENRDLQLTLINRGENIVDMVEAFDEIDETR